MEFNIVDLFTKIKTINIFQAITETYSFTQTLIKQRQIVALNFVYVHGV